MSSSSRRRGREQLSDDYSSDSASDSQRHRNLIRKYQTSESKLDKPTRSRSKREITDKEIEEYLAKKAQKKAIKVARKLKSHTVTGYSNDSNPFGDSNLNEKFVWRKKIERDISQGVPLDEFSMKTEKKRQRERMAEIEKVKKRREERAVEKAQHEEEMALLARERARAEYQDWEKKEEEFHFDQSKIRSRVRLREGRTKPIDVLTKYLDPSDEFEKDINEPYMVFKGLAVKEMEEVHNDIKMHLDLDRATPTHTRYWEALQVVCEWELAEARKRDALERARVRGEQLNQEMIGEERGLHASVEADVKRLLQGKSFGELEVLQSQIESQMRSGTAKVVEYWEAVLKRLHIFKAKACLKEIHAKMLHKHLEHLETQSEDENNQREQTPDPDVQDPIPQEEDVVLSPKPLENVEIDDEELTGSYSPELLHGDEDEDAIDPEVDKAILERKRTVVLEERRAQEQASRSTPPEDTFEKNAMKAIGALEEGEVVFGSNNEINLDSQVYWWHDKYRPRKPKYFNRVHTGYEWNKYNQTHYDHDNPPPIPPRLVLPYDHDRKCWGTTLIISSPKYFNRVQGYKFNIFYPDLVDKSDTPKYTIAPDTPETCIIRYHAGPPYEDIAFRIVNKEWEYSHKKGFKSTFERGILHLYFNFIRYRYRR